jgi:hypothetical protein
MQNLNTSFERPNALKRISLLVSLSTFLLAFSASTYACEFKDVHFTANFDAAKLDACVQLADDEFSNKQYELLSKPENSPINPSPWYAFKVINKTPANTQELSLVLKSEGAKARYSPKMSLDGTHWQPMPFEIIDNNIHIKLKLTQEAIYIAAQEIVDNAFYAQWMNSIAENSPFSLSKLGLSTQGREINALVYSKPENNEWFLIIGRQHPPEITGALALISFVEQLSQQHGLNRDFLARFNVMIVPNLNPDGVAHGNWRHNTQGLDLNRDWGMFTQTETQQVKSWLDLTLIEQQRLVFALDFHSTQQDVFYTMPSDYALAPQDFSKDWLKRLKSATLSSFVVRPRPGTSPGRGVFKQYLADEYKIHSITYETGDNTERQLIRHVAEEAAKTLMQKMLDTEPESFVFTPSLLEPVAEKSPKEIFR